MSEEQKPEPSIDKDGMPWCNNDCIHYHCHGLGATESGHTCQISGEGMEVWEGCYPAVRKMAAEIEQLKIALQRAVAGPDMYDHYRVLSKCPPNYSLGQWLKKQAQAVKEVG